jgi:hypothetical protein
MRELITRTSLHAYPKIPHLLFAQRVPSGSTLPGGFLFGQLSVAPTASESLAPAHQASQVNAGAQLQCGSEMNVQ